MRPVRQIAKADRIPRRDAVPSVYVDNVQFRRGQIRMACALNGPTPGFSAVIFHGPIHHGCIAEFPGMQELIEVGLGMA
jgi:hypothetical protein